MPNTTGLPTESDLGVIGPIRVVHLEMSGTIGGVDIMVEWQQATGDCEFSPRDALDLSWSDFLNFTQLHNQLLDAIDRF